MIEKIISAIERYGMLDDVGEVTAAVSGGADSMCLLYILNDIKSRFGFKLTAAHLNHGIRGEEADRDERFVKDECEKLGVQLFCERLPIPQIARDAGKSLELAAREERYKFFSRVANGVVATAHTASDNAETMVMNMVRGASLKGLCGIPKVRGCVIRPLIFCTREEIEDYCRKNGISYCTDSTNADIYYSRNRIRKLIIPQLKELNPNLENTLSAEAELNSADEDYMQGIAAREYGGVLSSGSLDILKLQKFHRAIRGRVLTMYYKSEVNCDAEKHFIDKMDALCFKPGRTGLKNGCFAVSSGGRLKIIKETEDGGKISYGLDLENGVFECPALKILPVKGKVNKMLLKNVFDCDKIIGNPTVRTRKTGDKIKLSGRNCTKSVKKLFIDEKIPVFERDKILLLCDRDGVIWIERFGISERVKPDCNSKNLFTVKTIEEC